MAALLQEHDSGSQAEDDSYAIIEKLADAIRIEDDVQASAVDRAKLVRDLFEGPRQCECCINWIDDAPCNVDLEAADDADEDSHPIILRRRIFPGVNKDSKAKTTVHSVEIRSSAAREALFEVFSGLDGLHPDVKYLIFRAPFYQFFWRWQAFEKAIADQENEKVKAVLVQLRAIVKRELADAFAVSNELTSNGVITFRYLWTLFPPGELIYSSLSACERFFMLLNSHMIQQTIPAPRGSRSHYQLNCRYVDWDGHNFGWLPWAGHIFEFKGTCKITDLAFYPAKYMADQAGARDRCIARGLKFRDLAGIQYKSYVTRDRSEKRSKAGARARGLDRRIVLDSRGHPNPVFCDLLLGDPSKLPFSTDIISQMPVDATPPGGHRPLEPLGQNALQGRPPARKMGGMPPNWMGGGPPRGGPRPPAPRGMAPPPVIQRRMSVESMASVDGNDEDEDKQTLTDIQLQLCGPTVRGYCLQRKKWGSFSVDRVEDVEWNTSPFESLVLPDGYKDLILSFVESQLKEGDTFDDVINGKGGGLVILLAGDPGVGKTLTAESVAEKIHAPLYKMELGDMIDDDDDDDDAQSQRRHENELFAAFNLAAKWKAVFLIDECDLYLEKRSDASPKRNRLVSRFLQQLEYYPSLLFLTTNREKVLDPGVYSRIHLTINYPGLDTGSRRLIWKTFLDREGSSVSEAELDKLAELDLNGRRIRNVTKTARIMAKRAGRTICSADVQQVMRITEGVEI